MQIVNSDVPRCDKLIFVYGRERMGEEVLIKFFYSVFVASVEIEI